MDLTRSQLSLIITGFSLAILVLTLFNLHLGSSEKEEYVIEMSLADEDIEALLEEEEKKLEELQAADPVKSHMAFNETAKPTYGAPEPLKTLEEIMAEREELMGAEENKDYLGDSEAFNSTLRELAKKREEKKQLIGEKEAEKKEYTNNLAERRTSISYSLVDRSAYELPPPIYTCIEGGKVVVNIKVDKLGFVVEADYNKSSTTSNGCLIDNAIAYALKARFSPAQRSEQPGTITYLFQSK
ncbi:energy transducer TonB family protein [Robiginitalea sp. IMCC43444]|uniref:energy transducer TonB family protein n=1 Tax=Robiginitalea sp. IMCC43444 TaxID=3459121 RepID=UPI0040416A2A